MKLSQEETRDGFGMLGLLRSALASRVGHGAGGFGTVAGLGLYNDQATSSVEFDYSVWGDTAPVSRS